MLYVFSIYHTLIFPFFSLTFSIEIMLNECEISGYFSIISQDSLQKASTCSS